MAKAIDPDEALQLALQVAAREVKRLADKAELVGWESADLERYVGILVKADHHKLNWLAKLDPGRLPEELVRRVLAMTDKEEEPKRGRRAGA
ncbi:MAG: hypothetical protein LC640_08900 [Frankia sp.]|nr:hypothetical protein [Frankia sp.]